MKISSLYNSYLVSFITLLLIPLSVAANADSELETPIAPSPSALSADSESTALLDYDIGCGWWRPCGRWFLAPQNYASGMSVQGVDPATGVLRHSQRDIAPVNSGLGLRRYYQSSRLDDGHDSLGGWRHNYSRRLGDNRPIEYNTYEGLKSDRYRRPERACRQGWKQIRHTAYNGQYAMARAKYQEGLCNIQQDGETLVRLPLYRTGHGSARGFERHPHAHLKSVSRPDGTVYTFVYEGGQWQSLSKIPVTLKRIRRGGWVFTNRDGSTEHYTARGQLRRLTNAEGQTTKLRYDRQHRLVKVIGPFGRELRFTYHHRWWGQRLHKVSGPSGDVRYTYDRRNRLIKARYQDGTTRSYRYEETSCRSCLTAIADATGEVTQHLDYDAHNRVTGTEGADGSNPRYFDYDHGQVVVSDAAEAETRYSFGLHHGLLKIAQLTDPAGQSEYFAYDASGYPASRTAKNGAVTETEYNERGLLDVQITAAGTDAQRATTFEWHPQFRKPTERSEPGQTTAFDYDGSGRLTRQVLRPSNTLAATANDQPLEERVTAYAYNKRGQVTETVAPNGAVTQNAYDEASNKTSTTNALGQKSETLAFDDAGRPLKTRDANGSETENEYDAAGRLVQTTVNGLTTSYEYDAAGRQTKVIYPDGSTLENTYDTASRLTQTMNQHGEVTEYRYDTNGNRIKTQVTDAEGQVVESRKMAYDTLNRLIKETDPLGHNTTFEYDASGNRIKITDAKGRVTRHEYDRQNRLVKTINAADGLTEYAYDLNGNRTQVVAPNGATTTFAYDSFNQLTGETSPDRGDTGYGYDAAGNQTQITDANGNIKTIEYDLLGRMTQESWDDHPELTIQYLYDECNNGVGRLCEVSDASGVTRYGYNADGLIMQKDQFIDGVTLTQQFVYTDDQKVQSQTYPSGAVIGYVYDSDRLTDISVDGTPFIQYIEYDQANRVTRWQWVDGSTHTRTYDQAGRLTAFTLGKSERHLDYDAAGNITGWTESGSDEYKVFGYDALDRLTAFHKNRAIPKADDETLRRQAFTYDANGNRTQLVEDGAPIAYQIEVGSNRLIDIDGTAQQHDAGGNLIDDGEYRYTYDARNRLVSVNDSSYLYNADNQRIKKTTPDGTVLYAWTGERIFGEYHADGNTIQETIYLGGTPVGMITSGDLYRIHADQIDTPRVITDQANTIVWQWESAPFGENYPDEDPDGDKIAFSYNLRFPGQYYDQETQKHYNFHRDYNPATGRYMQSDPIGLDGGVNTFTYVASNPVKFYDLDGLIIYVQWHDVTFGYYHSLIRIIPDDQSYQSIAPSQYRYKENGKWFTTIGAGPSGSPPFLGNLKKGYNRDKDVNQAKDGMALIPTPWNGMSEKTIINKLFTAFSKYDDGLEYEMFPDVGQGEYNSNGFVNGILQSVGINIVKPYSGLAGWEVPVATAEFK